ncbi:hypothetical protein DV096_17855 [Bradymonadaceae bacterium TMQ3]|nr:hypothetical protein DV096_17855 [Bradymonadaceae bacterium TMQ3]TXC68608.1 hypothetical protein FRC91_18705 [Bradymonadales bacterium TMQ1]
MSAHAPDDKLLDLLYGELPSEEARALRAELDADPERRAAYEELRASRDLIARHTSQPARVPSTLTERILEDARTHTPSHTRSASDPRQSLWRRAWHSPGFRQSLVAAALLLGVAGILRALQLDTTTRPHDPLAEHGMAAPVSFETSALAENAKREAMPDEESSAAAEEAPTEGAISETTNARGAGAAASARPQAEDHHQPLKRTAPAITAEASPAREAEPRPRTTPSPKPRASRRAEAPGAALADSPTDSTARAPQRAASPRRADSYGVGRSDFGATAPAAPQAQSDTFAPVEDRLDTAPTRERASAPSAEPSSLAASGGASLKQRSATPSTTNEHADIEADTPSADEDELVASPPPSLLQRARHARSNNDAEATLSFATRALSSERSPRARAEAYSLMAWAQEQLGDNEAAQHARDQAATLQREIDAAAP